MNSIGIGTAARVGDICFGLPEGWAWKDVAVSKLYPCEFCDEVVRVVRDREPGVRIKQIVKDFGVHPMMLQRWMRRADIDEGAKPGQTRTESVELREACKRVWLLGQGNEVFRWAAGYLLRANLLGKGGYPLVTELPTTFLSVYLEFRWSPFVTEPAAAGIPVTVRCRVLTRSPASPTTGGWQSPITTSEVVEAYRTNALFDGHKDDPGFGPRVARRQGPRRRRSDVGSHGVADRIEQQLVVRVREETGARWEEARGHRSRTICAS